MIRCERCGWPVNTSKSSFTYKGETRWESYGSCMCFRTHFSSTDNSRDAITQQWAMLRYWPEIIQGTDFTDDLGQWKDQYRK